MDDVNALSNAAEGYGATEYLGEAAGFLRTLASVLYKELSQEQIDALAEIDFMPLRESTENPDLARGFYDLGRYLHRRGIDARHDLAVEYARIFLSAGVTSDDKCAAPYESVFTSPEGLLMQDARDDVVRVYRSQGFEVDKSLNDIEDHLAFELQFLAGMAERTRQALLDGEPVDALLHVQIEFIDEHILNWIDALATRVANVAESAFYPAIMRIIKGYVVEHRAILQELAES